MPPLGQHTHLAFQHDEHGIEFVELRHVQLGYHTVNTCHSLGILSQEAESCAHLGLVAQSLGLGTLPVAYFHQLTRMLQPAQRVILLAGGIGQNFQHVLLTGQTHLDGVVTEQSLGNDACRVARRPFDPMKHRIEQFRYLRTAVDSRPVEVCPPVGQVSHDDR